MARQEPTSGAQAFWMDQRKRDRNAFAGSVSDQISDADGDLGSEIEQALRNQRQEIPPFIRRLREIEQASGATLPTQLVMGLAQSDTRDEQLTRASRVLARMFDIPPNWLLGFYGDRATEGEGQLYRDPVTSGPLSLETARRIVKPYEAKVMRRLLVGMLDAEDTEHHDKIIAKRNFGSLVEKEEPINVRKVLNAFVALSPVGGLEMNFGQAMAVAVGLAKSDTDLKVFAQNLRYVQTNAKGLSAIQRVGVSAVAADSGHVVNTPAQVAFLAAPEELQSQAAGQINPLRQQASHEGVQISEDPLDAIAQLQLAGFIPTNSPMQRALEDPDDFNETADRLIAQMRLEQQDNENSFLGTALRWAGNTIDVLNGVGDVALYVGYKGLKESPQLGFIKGMEFLASHDPADLESGFKWETVTEDWRQMKDLYFQRETFGDYAARELGYPKWSAPIIELGASWFFAPDNLAGTAVRLHREARLLTEKTAFSWMGEAARLLDTPQRRLGGDTVPQFLVNGALRAGTPEASFLRATDRFRFVYGTSGLNRTLSAAIFGHVRQGRRLGTSVDELVLDVRELLAAGFAGSAAGSKLAERVSRYKQQLDLAHDSNMTLTAADETVDATKAAAQAEDNRRALYGILDDWDAYFTTHGPLMLERPTIAGRLPFTGVGRRMSIAMRGVGGDTAVGRTLSGLLSTAPDLRGARLLTNIEDNPADDLVQIMRRSRVFNEQQLATAKLEMAGAASPTNIRRETSTLNTVKKWNDLMLARVDAELGVPTDLATQLREQAWAGAAPVGAVPAERHLYGIMQRSDEQAGAGLMPDQFERPLARTQLQNEFEFIDPVWYRRGIAESMGTIRKVRAHLLRSVGKVVPESQLRTLAKHRVTLPKIAHATTDLLIRDLFLSWWKPLVVLRPAYIVRVVGLEEQARFAATMGLLSRMSGGKVGGRVLNAVDRMTGAPTSTRYVVSVPDPADPTKMVDEVYELPTRSGSVPFGAAGNDPLAANDSANLAKVAFVKDGPVARRVERAKLSSRRVGPVYRQDPQFYDELANDLNNQIGRDPIWARTLENIADGVDEDLRIVNDVFDYVKGNKQLTKEAQRVLAAAWDVPPSEFNDDDLWQLIERQVHVARNYTGSYANPAIAATTASAALDESLDPRHLRNLAAKDERLLPEMVHGAEIEMLTGKPGAIRDIVSAVHRTIMQLPTNTLSRHPYFREWRSRMLKGMLDLAEDSGVPLTRELIDSMEEQARRFALSQVRRIMFDFTKQSRLGEVMSYVMPFFQPFSEAFLVWGRIARQNPAIFHHARVLWQAGEETGFIREDPDTGEKVISLDWWLGAGLIKNLMPDELQDQFSFSAPLSSINFFFQGGIPVPIGEGGQITVPMPGLSPPAQFVLQKALDNPALPISDGARARLAAWAYQYGPITPASFMPTYMRHFASAVLPGTDWFEPNVKRQANNMLVVYQLMGLEPSTSQPPPNMGRAEFFALDPERRIDTWKRYLHDRSMADAQSMELARGIASLYFPTPPKISFPTDQAERDFSDLIEHYDSFDKAREAFLSDQATGDPFVDARRHPDLSLATVAKSVWAPDPASFLGQSPVSIPSNKYIDQLVHSKGFVEFANAFPEWAWAIIPNELREADFDSGSYFRALAEGTREARSPWDTLTEDQVQKGWDAYFAIRSGWTAEQERLTDLDISQTSNTWERSKLIFYDNPIDELKNEYPDWESDFGDFSTQGVSDSVMAQARELVKLPAFTKTEVGQGLAAYLELRDSLYDQMSERNVTSLDTVYAQKKGYAGRYERGLKAIYEQWPQFETAYQVFFRNDLQGIPTHREKILGTLDDETAEQIEGFDQLRANAQDAIEESLNDVQRSEAFLRKRELEDSAYEEFPNKVNPMLLTWRSMRPDEKREARLLTINTPYVYLSQYDRRTVLGVKTNKAAEETWRRYGETLLDISRIREANPDVAAGELYDAVDRVLADEALRNPMFAGQLQAANDWTFMVRQTVEGAQNENKPQHDSWRKFLDAVATVQSIATRRELHGDTDFGEAKVAYQLLRQQLEGYRDHLFDTDQNFKREYLNVERALGADTLMEHIMPSVYYPLGGKAFAPGGV